LSALDCAVKAKRWDVAYLLEENGAICNEYQELLDTYKISLVMGKVKSARF